MYRERRRSHQDRRCKLVQFPGEELLCEGVEEASAALRKVLSHLLLVFYQISSSLQ